MFAKFMSTLHSSLPEKTKHERKRAYMAENGIRQLGSLRIGQFADRQRPEPLHCEINVWQQILSIIYLEFVKKNMFDVFVRVLSNPTTKPATANGASGTTSKRLPSTAGGEADSVYNGSSAKPVTANSTGAQTMNIHCWVVDCLT